MKLQNYHICLDCNVYFINVSFHLRNHKISEWKTIFHCFKFSLLNQDIFRFFFLPVVELEKNPNRLKLIIQILITGFFLTPVHFLHPFPYFKRRKFDWGNRNWAVCQTSPAFNKSEDSRDRSSVIKRRWWKYLS